MLSEFRCENLQDYNKKNFHPEKTENLNNFRHVQDLCNFGIYQVL